MTRTPPYIISDITSSISHKDGEDLYTITFIDINTDQKFKTYIQATNRNFNKWKLIIDNSADGWVIEGLRIKDKTKSLINADSKINVLNRIPQGADDLMKAYYEER